MSGVANSARSSWVCTSIKPGATILPATSISRAPVTLATTPTAAMRSPVIAMSAGRRGRPLPSTTSPPRRIQSVMLTSTKLFGTLRWMSQARFASEPRARTAGLQDFARWSAAWSPRTAPQEPSPPGTAVADGKAHLGFEGVEVELDEIGETPLEHEVGDAARELQRLVGVAAKADGQLA